jgi:hypothetical protein
VKTRILFLGVAVLALVAAAPVWAGDFMDTWVTFAFSDDNLFAGAEDRSPRAGFHYNGDQAFFDNFNRSTTGYETMAHLVLYKAIDSYFKNLTLEAALVLQLENVTDKVTWQTETQLRDDGSYIKLNFLVPPTTAGGADVLALTLFPIDSDRFRLGYSYDISWGGNETWPTNTNPAPGAKLRWDYGTAEDAAVGGYLFGGAKAVRLLNEDINEEETYYGYLGGLGLDFGKSVMWEVNGGEFEKGVFPPQSFDSKIAGKKIESHGLSTRLSWRRGLPIGDSVDFRLYKKDLETVKAALDQEEYGPGLSHRISGEFTYREQTMLKWSDPETTIYQPAMAGVGALKLKYSYFRFHTEAVYRQLAYILFDVPGLAPYYALPNDATITDEMWGDAGIDYFFPSAHLTLGLIGGYKRPATYKGPTDIPEAAGKESVIVVRDLGDLEILPPGEKAFDIVTVKPTARFDLAEGFSLLGEVQYTIDKNRTKYVETDNGAKRVFEDSDVTNSLGFSLLMQARF